MIIIKAIIVSHSNLRLKRVYTLTSETFVDAYPQTVNPDLLEKVLNTWALSFGDLSTLNPEHLFLGNPVWQKPLINLEDGTYFCPVVPLFLNCLTELMEAIIKPHQELYKRLVAE